MASTHNTEEAPLEAIEKACMEACEFGDEDMVSMGLEEAVHDIAAGIASEKNNSGLASQIAFIVEQSGLDEGIGIIEKDLDIDLSRFRKEST